MHNMYIVLCVHYPKCPSITSYPSLLCPTPFLLEITILLSVSMSFSFLSLFNPRILKHAGLFTIPK